MCCYVKWFLIKELIINLLMLNKLIIGTVQFGLDYGITNKSGKVNNDELDKIFAFCFNNKINTFDTAQDYGTSENILSNYKIKYQQFNIITKAKFINKDINETIKKSVEKFNKINYFLLHSYNDYNNNIINNLIDFQNKELIDKIGVSVYNVDEAILLLDDSRINVIQIPFNYIDSQWDNELFITKLQSRPDIEIHVRSIFLQGVLLNPIINKPTNIDQKDLDKLNNIINELTNEFNLNKLELCFAYINSFNWINKFLIGIDNYEHLISNYNIINKNLKLTNEQIQTIKQKTTNINKILCDPSKWRF